MPRVGPSAAGGTRYGCNIRSGGPILRGDHPLRGSSIFHAKQRQCIPVNHMQNVFRSIQESTQVMNDLRSSPFSAALRLCIIVNANRRGERFGNETTPSRYRARCGKRLFTACKVLSEIPTNPPFFPSSVKIQLIY